MNKRTSKQVNSIPYLASTPKPLTGMAARVWHKAPFLRILLPLSLGIAVQWNAGLSLPALLVFFSVGFFTVVLYSLTGVARRFRWSVVNGAALCLLFASLGALLTWANDVRNNDRWLGHWYKDNDGVSVVLQEPLVEKANSYKALASIESLLEGSLQRSAKGEVIVYFKKDSAPPPLRYGSRIVFTRPLQEIKNGGNPGSFDYKTYSLFNGITHQVYVTAKDYIVLPGTQTNPFEAFIYATRSWVVDVIKTYVPGEKESGLAEALLIGYKDDLDKNLVQAYSNTGVVHIIAISGLHLGLIYWLLLWITKPLKRNKKALWLRLPLVVSALWLFSLLAGGGPSVLRSAVMFSIIAFGEVALRRTNIFNNLALSATVLLCINPFWLWDVGFQLSYAAVLSIVLFYRPVYNWYRPANKAVDFLWSLTAVTVAAQILTMAVSIYHFHQMPLLFLATNFIAVPLSSLVLFGEILLCGLFFLSPVAKLTGFVLHHLIRWMNDYIEGLDALPFAVWNGLSVNVVQTILLTLFCTGGCYWLMEKERRFAWTALSSFALFMIIRAASFAKAEGQKKLVVYNVPKHTAVDLINGRQYVFVGDTALLYDEALRNFHLQPSRILHRITPVKNSAQTKSFEWEGKQVLLMDEGLRLAALHPKQAVDVLILAKNPKLYMPDLLAAFSIKQVVIDGSVPAWKAARWKKDCDSLKIPCYDVSGEGAFVME